MNEREPDVGEFLYLLNAMELAAQEACPADHNFASKRGAVLAYVAGLRAQVAALIVDAEQERELCAELVAPRWKLRHRLNGAGWTTKVAP